MKLWQPKETGEIGPGLLFQKHLYSVGCYDYLKRVESTVWSGSGGICEFRFFRSRQQKKSARGTRLRGSDILLWQSRIWDQFPAEGSDFAQKFWFPCLSVTATDVYGIDSANQRFLFTSINLKCLSLPRFSLLLRITKWYFINNNKNVWVILQIFSHKHDLNNILLWLSTPIQSQFPLSFLFSSSKWDDNGLVSLG
jgi:hypothetical protein